MKNPEYLTSPGVTRAATLDYAATLARRTGHPVGVTVLETGSSLLYVLDTPELKEAEFEKVICPNVDEESPHLVPTASDCAAESPATAVPA